ncbi:MAG: adenylyl-sulfate kinase [Sphingomonadales bacterium]|nr:adenylyl-sulfate kinase [Sphingomonadales bacterium]
MAHKVLIFGLPGAGKTYLAERLSTRISCAWFNADDVRKKYDDWDFSNEGRLRQATRMQTLANAATEPVALVDFVCPTNALRDVFNANTAIWLNTIQAGRYEDTNKLFEVPTIAHHIIDHFYSDAEIDDLAIWLIERAQKEIQHV